MGNAPLPNGLESWLMAASAGGVTIMVMGVAPEWAETIAGENTTVLVGGSPLELSANAAGIVAPPNGVTTREKLAGLPGFTVGALVPDVTAIEKS